MTNKLRRDMLFRDDVAAKPLLLNISYYRLKGYWWDMQSDRVNHKFFPESYFEDVIERYYFDRQLRAEVSQEFKLNLKGVNSCIFLFSPYL